MNLNAYYIERNLIEYFFMTPNGFDGKDKTVFDA